MVVPVSSLSIAIAGVADFLDTQLGPEVSVSVDSPQTAAETAKTSTSTHILNLFVYRVAPSAFYPDLSPTDPLFLRLYALLTPFRGAQTGQAGDAEHRILGNAIRVLASNPVLPPILPGPAGADPDDFRLDPATLAYRVQAVMQAPTMEELNHIWTTQGGELAYRLSAAYEFAVAAIEPMARAPASPPTTTAVLDVGASAPRIAADGFLEYSEESRAIPLGTPPAVGWLPIVLAVTGDALSTRADVAPAAADIDIAIAGLVGEQVAIDVIWTRAAAPGAPDPQPTQIFPVLASLVSNPAAIAQLTLDSPAAGDVAALRVRAASGGAPIPGAPDANTLTLTVSP
jgi:hypothetical protein